MVEPVIIILGLGFGLVSAGALVRAWRHGVDCRRCLRGGRHER